MIGLKGVVKGLALLPLVPFTLSCIIEFYIFVRIPADNISFFILKFMALILVVGTLGAVYSSIKSRDNYLRKFSVYLLADFIIRIQIYVLPFLNVILRVAVMIMLAYQANLIARHRKSDQVKLAEEIREAARMVTLVMSIVSANLKLNDLISWMRAPAETVPQILVTISALLGLIAFLISWSSLKQKSAQLYGLAGAFLILGIIEAAFFSGIITMFTTIFDVLMIITALIQAVFVKRGHSPIPASEDGTQLDFEHMRTTTAARPNLNQ